MSNDQARRAQLGRQQFLEPQGRRVTAPGKLGHEDDAALLDLLGQRFQLGQLVGQRQRTVHRFSRGACQGDGMKPEPLTRQEVDHIDVGPLDKCRQSLAGRAADLGGLELGPAKHRVVHGRHPEPIVQTGQGRLVPGFPEPAQPDDSHTEPHVLRPDQARLLATRSLLAMTLAVTVAVRRLSACGILGYPNSQASDATLSAL